jgi:arylsulfatase A-like enzyme
LRIPALVRWPGHIPSGSKTQQVAISMDWMPTLLQVAGTQPDPAYPMDGMSLGPTLTQNAAPLSRKLFWRYKNNAQQALRDGDYKFLLIAGNTFLFNVVSDPLERANLKEREPERYRKMIAEYEAWNATMLPIDPKSSTSGFTADHWADHYNNQPR